jgi:hypothetical protein
MKNKMWCSMGVGLGLAGCSLLSTAQPAKTVQTDTINFDLSQWVYKADRVTIQDSQQFPGTQEMIHSGFGPTGAYLKDTTFSQGTIECDMAGGAYLGISFRVKPDDKDRISEDVYFRVENDQRPNTVQYYPHGKMKQEELHQPPFEMPTRAIKQKEWFHVRIEVNEHQARVYLDNSKEPIQVIDKLLHEHKEGSVGFRSWGNEAKFANLRISRKN